MSHSIDTFSISVLVSVIVNHAPAKWKVIGFFMVVHIVMVNCYQKLFFTYLLLVVAETVMVNSLLFIYLYSHFIF